MHRASNINGVNIVGNYHYFEHIYRNIVIPDLIGEVNHKIVYLFLYLFKMLRVSLFNGV